ncbi:NADH dehydrogenase [ubiquinone] 1 alpha subcomplex assembly factor 2 [Pelodytes ibericus]
MDKLRTLLQRTLGTVRQHMGTDQFGNKYFYTPEQKNFAGQRTRARRTVECINKKDYESGDIPTEWEAWIRGKRSDPPTTEEIIKNEKFREEIKMKGSEIEEKDKLLKSQANQEGLIAQPKKTQIKGHASASVFGRQVPSEEPVSTGNTFEPGSWTPGSMKQEK